MKKLALTCILLFYPTLILAHQYGQTTKIAMACFIIAPDEKWTFKDFGFTLHYKDANGKKHKLSANTSDSAMNCTDKAVFVSAKIPAGPIKINIHDFTGEAGSTLECTNTIKYKLTPKQIGKHCGFVVKSFKTGAYTSNDECSIKMTCS
jgi:hypothetical protein